MAVQFEQVIVAGDNEVRPAAERAGEHMSVVCVTAVNGQFVQWQRRDALGGKCHEEIVSRQRHL